MQPCPALGPFTPRFHFPVPIITSLAPTASLLPFVLSTAWSRGVEPVFTPMQAPSSYNSHPLHSCCSQTSQLAPLLTLSTTQELLHPGSSDGLPSAKCLRSRQAVLGPALLLSPIENDTPGCLQGCRPLSPTLALLRGMAARDPPHLL